MEQAEAKGVTIWTEEECNNVVSALSPPNDGDNGDVKPSKKQEKKASPSTSTSTSKKRAETTTTATTTAKEGAAKKHQRPLLRALAPINNYFKARLFASLEPFPHKPVRRRKKKWRD